jgi:dTDP-glucose 4,6-dehydratase
VLFRSLTGHKVPIYGLGNNQREWIYVQDFVKTTAFILQSFREGKISGSIFNVSSRYSLTNLMLVYLVMSVLGIPASEFKDRVEFVPDRKGHDRKYAISENKMYYELNCSNGYTDSQFKDLLRATIEDVKRRYVCESS